VDQQGFEPPTAVCQKARQKLQGIQNIPSQRVTDLEAAIRQLRQIGCILDSCTISASYEVSQAQKATLLLDHTAKGASTSSEELNAQISPRTDDEHNLPYHEDYLQEHQHSGACCNRNVTLMLEKGQLSGLFARVIVH